MKAFNKVLKLINIYLDNNSYINLMQILDANVDTVKNCIHELLFKLKKQYQHYLSLEQFKSAFIIKQKLNRLNHLQSII